MGPVGRDGTQLLLNKLVIANFLGDHRRLYSGSHWNLVGSKSAGPDQIFIKQVGTFSRLKNVRSWKPIEP